MPTVTGNTIALKLSYNAGTKAFKVLDPAPSGLVVSQALSDGTELEWEASDPGAHLTLSFVFEPAVSQPSSSYTVQGAGDVTVMTQTLPPHTFLLTFSPDEADLANCTFKLCNLAVLATGTGTNPTASKVILMPRKKKIRPTGQDKPLNPPPPLRS